MRLLKSSPTFRLILIALGLFLLYTFIVWRSQPIPARGANIGPNEFSATVAFDLLSHILAEEVAHETGTEANQRVRQRIEEHFAAIGYDAEIQAAEKCNYWTSRCYDIENIVTRLPGTGDGPAVMLVAHYDSVRAGPGVADDGAGVVTVLETARILREEGPFTNPIIFLLTDGEEIGLLGARAFVEEHPWAKDVGMVLNFEARGTSGASAMFETSEENGWLIEQFAQVANRPTASSFFFEIYKIMPNDTDLTIFKDAGMAGYGFAFADDVEQYHTPDDNLANLSLDSLQHHGDNALSLARHLANADLSTSRASNLIYHDVLSFLIVRYPVWLGQVLAVFTTLVLMGIAVVARRRKLATWLGLFIGVVWTVLMLSMPIGLIALTDVTGRAEQFWQVVPLPQASAILGVFVICALLASLLPKRSSAIDASLAAWICWSIAALILAFLLPGASIIFFLPVACAALLHLLLIWRAVPKMLILALTALCAALIWFKLAFIFDVALRIDIGPWISAVPMAIFATTLLPLLVENQRINTRSMLQRGTK